MNFYKKYILPKCLNCAMQKREIENQRSGVASKATGTVVEIGFGSGLNLPYYKNIKKIYAIDPSQELYALAHNRIKEAKFPVELIKTSAESIPLGDNSVDSVVSTWSLCSIPSAEKTLGEISRILKPGGKFIFMEHGKSSRKFIANLQKLLTPFSKSLAGGCHLNREIDTLIGNAGFEFQELHKTEQKINRLSCFYRGIAIAKNI